MPRHRLLQKFKEDRDSVLFGTDSFWQGVDVPGEALSNVILTAPALRRARPSPHPGQVRSHRRGRRRSLPRLLAARGHPEIPPRRVGRLIRTQNDKGIIVILDNRVLTKPYGKAFLAVLPKCPVEVLE